MHVKKTNGMEQELVYLTEESETLGLVTIILSITHKNKVLVTHHFAIVSSI